MIRIKRMKYELCCIWLSQVKLFINVNISEDFYTLVPYRSKTDKRLFQMNADDQFIFDNENLILQHIKYQQHPVYKSNIYIRKALFCNTYVIIV